MKINVGDVYDHRPGKTITEYDNHLFTLDIKLMLNMEKQQNLVKNLVVSPYTLSLLIGMSVSDCSQKAIANLGMDEVKFTAPVFHGDTIYGSSEVLDKERAKQERVKELLQLKTTEQTKIMLLFVHLEDRF